MGKKFTKFQLDGLKPKPKRYILFEDGGKGFGIRIEPSGRKTFFIEYRFNGKNRVFTIGPYPKVSLTQARAMAAQLKEQVESGVDPGLKKKEILWADKTAFTVKDLSNEYLEIWAKPRKTDKSYKEDMRILKKDVISIWGGHKAKDIKRRDVVLLLDQIVDRGSPVAANRTLAVVRRMFNFAVERDILEISPCFRVPAPTKEKSRERVLTDNEIRILWAGLDLDSNIPIAPGIKLALKLMLVSAQRKGEVVNSEWSEFDLDAGWWELPGEKTKNKKSHRIPISPLAMEILEKAKKYSKDSKWVFPSPVGPKRKNDSYLSETHPFTGPAIDHAVRRTLKNFELEHFTPHDLRRTAASQITGLGIPRLTVTKLLNHADSEITGIYDRHSYDSEKKHAILAWDAKLRSIIKGGKAKVLPIQKYT